MSHTVLRVRADERAGNGDRIGRSRAGGGSTTVPRLWFDDDWTEPSMMVGSAGGITVEEPERPDPPRLVLPDGSPIPRRRVGFRPPGDR